MAVLRVALSALLLWRMCGLVRGGRGLGEVRGPEGGAGPCQSAGMAGPPSGTPRMPSSWWSNDLHDAAQVQLRSKWMTWVRPRDGELSLSLAAVSTELPPVTEFFVVKRARNGLLGLKDSNGRWVSRNFSGDVFLSAKAEEGAAMFRVKQGGMNQIQLQGPQGMWLSVNSNGELSWAKAAGESETFDVREVMEVAAVRGVNLGGWLVVEGWMKMALFEGVPELVDGAAVQIRSAAKGCYASAEWGGGARVTCVERESPTAWETFRLRREGPDSAQGGVQLRSHYEWFCSAANESRKSLLQADVWSEPPSSSSATFKILEHPEVPHLVLLQAQNGKYLEVADNGELAFTCIEPAWDGPCAFRLTVSDGLHGEWQLAAGLGRERARERLEEHRAAFVKESDFKYLAEQGINLARIPVGYWITQGEETDGMYVPGGLKFLDLAFEWGAKYGIRIMIDLHGAPGSQNGLQETGSRDGIPAFARPGTENIPRALDAIEFLAERYSRHPSFFAIELLNEPSAFTTPLDVMSQYYEEGYRRVRKHSSCAYVVTSSRWMSTDDELKDILYGPDYTNVIMDVHWYSFWMTDKSVDEILNIWRNEKAAYLDYLSENGRLVFVGEWSAGLPTNYFVSDSDHRKFAALQLEVYGKHARAGWAFWSFKLEGQMSPWSFQDSRGTGWLPFQEVDGKIWGTGSRVGVAAT